VDDQYLSLKNLAKYSGLSVNTLRRHIDAGPSTALPCYRVGGKILVRRSEFDSWVAQWRQEANPELQRLFIEMGVTLN
jgi:excisionase family DNA binding protein